MDGDESPGPPVDHDEESELLSEFVLRVREMLTRADFLLPLAAGQRQYRLNNYNMASAAQLEDLFFDAFGRFVRENYPNESVVRRTGKELWDYAYRGLQVSHKEALSKDIAVWWTAGQKNSQGKYEPQDNLRFYSSPHPIVMVYSGNHAIHWETSNATPARTGKFRGRLGNYLISTKSPKSGNLVLGQRKDRHHMTVLHSWTQDEWEQLQFDDIWPLIGGPDLLDRDLYLDYPYASSNRGFSTDVNLGSAAGPELATTTDGTAQPGIYAIGSDQVVDVPLIANNRAHIIGKPDVEQLLQEAEKRGNFIPFPLWFANFADAAPPNLYAQQRTQFEDLFVARRRT